MRTIRGGRRRLWSLSLLLLLGGSLSQPGPALPTGAEKTRYRNPTVGAELAYQIPGMHRARVVRGLIYSRAGGRLRMDVYRPHAARLSKPLPVVLLGGPPAYRAGRATGQKVGWAQLISASGMAAVAFDIRSDNFLSTPHKPSRDVVAAIRYVRSHAGRLGIDSSRICTLGFSLGTAPWHLWATMRDPASYLRCNAVYYGPLDFEGFTDVPMEAQYVEEFSAITYLRKYGSKIPAMLVAKAGRDRFPSINLSIDRFAREAAHEGADVTVVTHARGVHGFDVENHNARSRQIVRQTLAFFRARLS